MIINLLHFCCYSMMAGWIEAVLYSRRGNEAFKWNEHVLYVAIAGIIGVNYLVQAPENIWDRVAVLICWALSHPFFHDGAYYEARKEIDVSYYWWFYDYSHTSEARMELRLWQRSAMLVAGISGFITYIFLK
jgi:hypothetical protein